MTMLKSMLLGATASLLVSATAAAHSGGWYLGFEVGINQVEDWQQAIVPTVPLLNVNASYESDFVALGSVGYDFGNDWRAELELGNRYNEEGEVRLFTIGGGSTIPDGGGELSQFTLLANVIYNVRLSDRFGLSLGAGLGLDHLEFEIPSGSDDDWFWAYQGIVGINYSMTPSVDLMLNYRYLSVGYDELDLGAGGLRPGDDVGQHTFSMGLRFDLRKESN